MTLASIWTVPDLATSVPPVDGAADVVVIGGGLTGLTTALLLARGGQQVVLLEADALGGVTTTRSTAKVSLLQGTRLSQLSRRHDQATVGAYVEAGREGQAWLRRFCEDHDVPHDERAAYTYATTDLGAARVEDEQRCAADLGVPVVGAHVVDLPFPVTGAATLPGQFQVDPGALVSALAREASEHGATLVAHTRVRKVSGTGPYRVRGDFGEVRAPAVVVATNYPVTDRAGQFAWFVPQRSYCLAVDGPGVDGMYLSADQPVRSLRTAHVDGRDLLLVGGEGHVTGRTDSAAAHLDRLRQWTDQVYGDVEEVAAWSAQDYSTANDLPWLGPVVPGQDRLLAAGGYAKWGFSTATAAALALSARLLGGQTPWARPLESWGPRLRGASAVGSAMAGTGLEMARGWGSGLVGGKPTRLCPHLGGPLHWNDAEASWDCPLHGSRFTAGGAVLEGPARCGLR